MPLRNRIIIIAVIIVLLVGAVAALVYFIPKKKAVNQPVTNGQVNIPGATPVKVGTEPTVIPQTAKPQALSPEQQDEVTVKNIARIFVERYHTYSTENNYQNIRDVRSLVTAEFWKKISEPLSSKTPPSSFSSVTVEVLGVEPVQVTKGAATVTIKAKKTATAGGKTTSTFGDYTVTLTKTESGWLVNGEKTK